MASKRKPPQKAGQLNFADELAQSVAKPDEEQTHETQRASMVGERVTVGTLKTIWTILSVSHSGKEVNLHVPGTNLERYRVAVADLNYTDSPRPQKPKEPEKPKIDTEAVREHLTAAHHAIIDHLNGEIAILKKWLRSKGFSADEVLDHASESIEASWNEAVEVIEEKLEE